MRNSARTPARCISSLTTSAISRAWRVSLEGLTREFGAFYGLVNNAALGTAGMLTNMPDGAIDQLIKLNVTSPITLTNISSAR